MSFKIGQRFVVVRPAESVNFGERIPLVLGGGRAFGSGEHETTRSCLEELENVPWASVKTVLDLGCGTGILAVAAVKLGAQSVTAVDPNPFAVETAATNVKLNSVKNQIEILQGELKDIRGKRYDLIMANLYGDVLLELVSDIPILLNSGGYLILSGIHYEYHYEVKTAFVEMGLTLLKNRMLEEYTTLILKKGP